jgi:hypothetical protein
MFNWLFGGSESAPAPINPPAPATADSPITNELDEAMRKIGELDGLAKRLRDQRNGARTALQATENALTDIANMETAGCAHIGRKMAGRARQALPGGGPAVRLQPTNGAAVQGAVS